MQQELTSETEVANEDRSLTYRGFQQVSAKETSGGGQISNGNTNAVTTNSITNISAELWTLIRILLRYKWLIFLITVLATSLMALQLSNTSPKYKSVATVEFHKQQQNVLGIDNASRNSFAERDYLGTQFVILRSKALASRVVQRLKLYKDPTFAPANLSKEDAIEVATQNLIRNTNVSTVNRTSIAKIEFISTDPAKAAKVANALVANYIDGTLERRYEETSYARRFLSERLALAKKNLENAEVNVQNYAKDNDIFDIQKGSEGTSLESNSILAINDSLSAAQGEKIEMKQKYEAIKAAPPVLSVLENENVQNLKARRIQLKAEYNEKLSIFKPKFPDMVKLKDQIDVIELEILTERQKILDATLATAEANYKASEAKEAALSQKVESLKGELQIKRDFRIQYSILEREVDTARTQYEGLLQRLKDVTISSGVGASQVSIVDEAVANPAPFSPNSRFLIGLTILGSLVGSSILSLVLHVIDDTIKTPEDMTQKLGLAVLTAIPKLSQRESLIIDELSDPRSVISEAFFAARTALQFSSPNGIPKSITLTSTRPSEGKSSCVTGLAITFAKLGKRVLLIDADLRKPSFMFDPRQSIGLSGLLTSEAELLDNVMATEQENLFLLPSGIIPPNPAEILSSWKVQRLIQNAEQKFDLVIVDLPPVMGFADALNISDICEGSILVVQAGRVRRGEVLRTIKRLQQSGANVLGGVLMRFDAKNASYGGEYYYAYGDGAYSYEKAVISPKSTQFRKIKLFEQRKGQETIAESQTNDTEFEDH